MPTLTKANLNTALDEAASRCTGSFKDSQWSDAVELVCKIYKRYVLEYFNGGKPNDSE